MADLKYLMIISPITFVKQSADELKKVVWPTREEVVRLTVAVVVISILVGIFIGGIDLGLTKLLEIIFRR